jgi:hypothetical protein
MQALKPQCGTATVQKKNISVGEYKPKLLNIIWWAHSDLNRGPSDYESLG